MTSCNNTGFIETYAKAAKQIQGKGYIEIREPSEEEKAMQNEKISIASVKKLSLREIVYSVLSEYPSLNDVSKEMILTSVLSIRNQKNENMTDEEIIRSTRMLADTYGKIQ